MPPINYNHFYYFYEVARHGSFTRAARALLVSQSALSVQIRNLEAQLGPLFDRRKTGVELTDLGQQAFSTAERVFTDVDQMMADLQETERSYTGAVLVATVNAIGIYVLPPVFNAFRVKFPEVRMNIDFQEGEGAVEMLLRGKVDFAIVPWNRRYPDLDGERLESHKLFLVVPPDHALATGTSVSPRDLERYPFVGYREGMVTRASLDALFKRLAISVEYAVESSNAATIKQMVLSGMGVAMLPEFAVTDELRRGALTRVDVPALRMTQDLMIYRRRNKALSPSRAQFAQFIHDHFDTRTRRGA